MHIPITYLWYKADDRTHIASLLNQGKVVVGHSDTVIGLLSCASSQGHQALDQIKLREHKPYILLIPSPSILEEYVQLPLIPWVQKLIHTLWPGPLTLILRARQGAPACLVAKDGTIAVRMPKHDGLLALMAMTGPLFSTSANLSGDPVPTTLEEINPSIVQHVAALIVDDKNDASPLPSTVVDCTGNAPRIVRQGAVAEDIILKLAGCLRTGSSAG